MSSSENWKVPDDDLFSGVATSRDSNGYTTPGIYYATASWLPYHMLALGGGLIKLNSSIEYIYR